MGAGARKASPRFCPPLTCAAFRPAISKDVLAALIGKDAANLSPSVISRLKGEWEGESERGRKRDLQAGPGGAPLRLAGPTASIFRRGWSRRPNACWS